MKLKGLDSSLEPGSGRAERAFAHPRSSPETLAFFSVKACVGSNGERQLQTCLAGTRVQKWFATSHNTARLLLSCQAPLKSEDLFVLFSPQMFNYLQYLTHVRLVLDQHPLSSFQLLQQCLTPRRGRNVCRAGAVLCANALALAPQAGCGQVE